MKPNIIIMICALLLTGCLGDAAGPTALGSWFNHDRRSAVAVVDDSAIAAKANLALSSNKSIWKDSHISTLTYNGSLLLVGQTKSQAYKDQIEKLVAPIAGVSKIYNQISVGQPIAFKDRSNDTWITTQVKAKLVANRDIGINRVKVITENGTVYLMGLLTQDEQQIAADIARKVSGVQMVMTVFQSPTGGP